MLLAGDIVAGCGCALVFAPVVTQLVTQTLTTCHGQACRKRELVIDQVTMH